MFKKRNNANKKIDLQQEVNRIEAKNNGSQPLVHEEEKVESPVVHEIPVSRAMFGKNKIRMQAMTLETMEVDQLAQDRHTGGQAETIGKEEISDYLNQIRKMKPLEPIQEPIEETGTKMSHSLLVQQHYNDQKEEVEDNYILDVEEDLEGGLSPERDDNPFHEDYEDELIRRTLTKHNYDKVRMRGGPNLADLKAIESQDKILQKLQKVTAKRIQNTIKRDLQQKMKKWQMLREDMRLKQNSSLREKKQIQTKQKRLNEMQNQLTKLNKVIEYIYFYGDKINTFEVGAILRQIKEEERVKDEYNFEDVS